MSSQPTTLQAQCTWLHMLPVCMHVLSLCLACCAARMTDLQDTCRVVPSLPRTVSKDELTALSLLPAISLLSSAVSAMQARQTGSIVASDAATQRRFPAVVATQTSFTEPIQQPKFGFRHLQHSAEASVELCTVQQSQSPAPAYQHSAAVAATAATTTAAVQAGYQTAELQQQTEQSHSRDSLSECLIDAAMLELHNRAIR